MKCPNCGFDFSEGYRCANCGIDVYIFEKTRNMSIYLYNDALEKAKEMDLSGAIENLEQSLLFDKNNIQARNLLGLLYAETGHIGDALKHWIISASLFKGKNLANDYMEVLQKNAREMEKCNDAISMYNQAISYLHQGSDDLAIIQLKKAIDNNPNFVDAYNLMILCCMVENNQKQGQHYIDIVLKKDVKNPTALRYAKLMGATIPASPNKRTRAKVQSSKNVTPTKTVSSKKTDSPPPLPRYKRKEKSSGVLEKRDIFSFLAGICITAIVLLVLVVPAVNEAKDKKIESLTAQVESYGGETGMTPEEVLAMREELQKLQNENKLLRSEETKQANLELLQTALAQLTDNDFEGCVISLDAIDTLGFAEDDLAKYNSLRATAFPKAADSLYTKGKSEFLSNNFIEAKVNLENSLKYAANENFVDDIYFYLAKIAESDKDIEKAKNHYQKVITDYPASNQLTNAKNALEQLEKANP